MASALSLQTTTTADDRHINSRAQIAAESYPLLMRSAASGDGDDTSIKGGPQEDCVALTR